MNTGRAVLGVAFVGVGALVLLEQQGVLSAGQVIGDWWPALLLVIAALDLVARPPRVVSATVMGLVGVVLLGVTTDLVDASVWEVGWPVALVAFGLWLLLRRPPAAGGVGSLEETVDVVAVFSGRRVVPTGPHFRGGTATAVFGGAEIDLTNVAIVGEALLDAVALFGGVDITVPVGWRVVLDGPAVFGGHESHVPAPAEPDAPILRVRATAIFGGVEVKPGANLTVLPPATAATSAGTSNTR